MCKRLNLLKTSCIFVTVNIYDRSKGFVNIGEPQCYKQDISQDLLISVICLIKTLYK